MPPTPSSAAPRSIAARLGFTLVETAVVLGVLSVLAAVGYNALSSARARQSLPSASGQMEVSIRRVRAESFATGSRTVLVVDAAQGRYWGLEDVGGTFDFASFDPEDPAPAPLRLLFSERLPERVTFGPGDGYGDTLPAPFAAMPADTPCTFCDPDSGKGYLAFRPGSPVRSEDGPLVGGSLTLTAAGVQRPPRTLVVNGRTGALRTFERSK